MTEAQAERGAAWQTFMSEPASYVADDRLAITLGGEVGPSLAKHLRGCGRLTARVSALIIQRGGLPAPIEPEELGADDRKIATASPDQLTSIVLRAGAILWSGAIANAVRGREVAAIEAALGAELRSFAIEHRTPGGLDRTLEPFDTLKQRVMEDGWRCYVGWCEAMPPAVGLRARMKMPGDPDPVAGDAALYSSVGPAILRLAAV